MGMLAAHFAGGSAWVIWGESCDLSEHSVLIQNNKGFLQGCCGHRCLEASARPREQALRVVPSAHSWPAPSSLLPCSNHSATVTIFPSFLSLSSGLPTTGRGLGASGAPGSGSGAGDWVPGAFASEETAPCPARLGFGLRCCAGW